MRKNKGKWGCFVAALCLLPGCAAVVPAPRTITAAGSSSAWQVATVVLEAFTLEYPEVTATYTNGGSMEGVLGVLYGVLDIAFATNAAASLPEGLVAVPFAVDGVAIIVHPDNPVSNLTTSQLRGIATGAYTNWRQLGGEDRPIHFVGGMSASGSRVTFEQALGLQAAVYDAAFMGEGGLREEVAHNPGAIGCLTFAMANSSVKTLAVDGIPLCRDTLVAGQYPVEITYHLVYNPNGASNEAVESFVRYFLATDKRRLAEAGGMLAYSDAMEGRA